MPSGTVRCPYCRAVPGEPCARRRHRCRNGEERARDDRPRAQRPHRARALRAVNAEKEARLW